MWSREFGEAAADPRFMLIGDTLAEIAAQWEEDGGISRRVLDAINQELASSIPGALDADKESGTAIIRSFRESVRGSLRDWIDERRGDRSRPD